MPPLCFALIIQDRDLLIDFHTDESLGICSLKEYGLNDQNIIEIDFYKKSSNESFKLFTFQFL